MGTGLSRSNVSKVELISDGEEYGPEEGHSPSKSHLRQHAAKSSRAWSETSPPETGPRGTRPEGASLPMQPVASADSGISWVDLGNRPMQKPQAPPPLPLVQTGPARSPSPKRDLEARVAELEALTRRQDSCIREMKLALASVQRDAPRTVSVMQYNILASYLGINTQPWFLYGVDLTPEQRADIMRLYYERGPNGEYNGWPKYVEGVLSPEEIAAVEQEEVHFEWENRKVKLVDEIQTLDADIISLVELDHFPYFEQNLCDQWDGVFHKRPRQSSQDGCGVFWRRTKFAAMAWQGFDMVDGCDSSGRKKSDRSCLIVILRWRSQQDQVPLVVVSTHLAKDPDDRAQTAIRVRQVTQIMEGLLEFTTSHGCQDAPVILLGDLNAKHIGEIRGIARTVWQVTGSQLHKFLFASSDVPTGPTSITKARQCRIDVVQYLSSHLEVLDVEPVPRLPHGQVIPNARHPSDHFPVMVRFRVKDAYEQHKQFARAWLECVAGREKLHPLTQAELAVAFEFFDRDRSGRIHRHSFEEACCELRCNYHVDIQILLLDCFPNNRISFQNFIRAYEARLNTERIRCLGELEYAFQFFANDSSTIELKMLEHAFREIIPISFSDEEVKEMIGRLSLKPGQGCVDVHQFCEVVAQANFPHRDRRKRSISNSMVRQISGVSSSLLPRYPEDSQGLGSWSHRSKDSGRMHTKELRGRLDQLSSFLSINSDLGNKLPTDSADELFGSGKMSPKSMNADDLIEELETVEVEISKSKTTPGVPRDRAPSIA